ncbi:HsdM family class I SAM-dependent methyltransferase [Pseudomonas sp. EggHat1]|uniref:HsdM family class I SAM-dependent methyltransferase n=1 Tax=Pseudomonas sp. EggHat1 TaxID=2761624 RepID=UPI0018684F4A|nr:N-6 DNA methylase [Pseudomonas sp. EggHat1]
MSEEYSVRLSLIVNRFRSNLALDVFEYRDFSLAIYFFSFISVRGWVTSSAGDEKLSGFERYVNGAERQGYSELLAYASVVDELLGNEFFLSDVVSSFFRKSFEAHAAERIRDFSREMLDFVSQDEIFVSAGDYFELLIKILSEGLGKRAGEDYTRRSLVELMVDIVQPKGGEAVYDPVCGSGGFLVAASRYALAHGSKGQISLKGREINFSSSRLARMNCYLHGCSDFSIKTESSFQFVDLGSFDVVLANPPFSMPFPESAVSVGPQVFEFGEPPRSNADYAFLQVIVKSLKSTGRAAVVVPQGVLFRGGVEGEIRRSMVLAGLIDAVISLPPSMLIGTSIPVSIMVLRGASARKEGVLFVDAAAAYEVMRETEVGVQSVEAAVLDIYRGLRVIEGASNFVSISVLEENEFNLSLSRYISPVGGDIASFEDLLNEQLALEGELDSLQDEFYRILNNSIEQKAPH